MKSRYTLAFILPLLLTLQLTAQDFTWDKETAGHFWPAKKTSAPGYNINAIFDLVNGLPVIARPKGYDVQEWFAISTEESPPAAHLYINFYYYYKYQNGPTQRLDAHPPTLSISINDPKALMDDQHYLFREETSALHLPVLFTDRDTFPVSEQIINGYRLMQGINTKFNRPTRFVVLSPKSIRLFRPVTKEEYLKAFIENLRRDIADRSKGFADSLATLEQLYKMSAVDKNAIDDMRKMFSAAGRFVTYEKSKMEYYQKKLASMAVEEKRAPAYYAMYKTAPLFKDRDGNYVEKMSGEFMYAPLEDTKDTLVTRPLFTFNEKAFDPKLAKNAIQLIVISEALQVDDDRELKRFFDSELYPFLPLKELAALMYK